MTIGHAQLTPAEELAAALDWWREAGLEHDFADAAHDWLARPETEAMPDAASAPPAQFQTAASAPSPQVRIGGDPAGWPQDLAGFTQWWMNEPSLDNGQTAGRVAPRGSPGAGLMIVVEHPEAGDRERLLAGPHGALIEAILRALGHDHADTYIAALLPRHMPLPDWAALADAGLGELARHHVALARPQRVIGFGPHVSSLLGHAPAKSGAQAAPYYPIGGGTQALAAPGLDSLLTRPSAKARLWQALLDWPES
ncbi:hypothetical protein [Novosphingobium sp.]|uniref:hypothetical protein n=1 Tax=Novosphingobium sp. TaxID=1874826 RepID=UPI00286A1164|nr:hypothetical protein [Novosphingobium sp.]